MRAFKNVSGGLVGTFISRNNDYEGYWALGKLKSLVSKSNQKNINVSIKPLEPSSSEPIIHDLSVRYRSVLDRMVERVGRTDTDVSNASIQIRFSLTESESHLVKAPMRGHPFCAEVTIVDRRGKAYSQRRYSICDYHDPLRESRSGRAEDT